MSTDLAFPPTDGSVTLPEVFDFHSERNPDHTLFTFHEDGAADITRISYFEFRRAADRVAHYIRPGRRGPEGEVMAVVALSDTVLYEAVSIGLMRAGIVPHLMSPRNTSAAIIKMLKETACHKLLTTQQTLKALVSEIKVDLAKDAYELEVIEMPPLFDIYPKLGRETPEDPVEEYPKVSVRPDLDDTLLYLHSSGSTGFPKSIRESFRMMCHWASFPSIGDVTRYSIGCMALPAFHTLGVISQLLRSGYGLNVIALYPPVASTPTQLPIMPTPDNIIDHLRRNKAESLVSIPALFQIWAQNPEIVKYLATLRMATFSGGPVPSKLGNFLIDSGVNLASAYGGTEFGGPTYPLRRAPGENGWEYISLYENIKVEWEPQGDGTYECQFLTNPNHSLPIENMTNPRGYATSDLFIPHPTEPGFWKIVGRKDDVIIHTSGEKTVPAPMENIISHSPYVMGVAMFGREHDQPGVLIELEPSYAIDPSMEADVIEARNSLWPVIEEANKLAPAFSRIFKEMILLVDPKKPLPRAGKGTVLRKAALAQYHGEIEALYATIESTAGGEAVDPPAAWTKEETSQWLKSQIEDILPDLSFTVEEDLFNQGMDSLGATILRRRIHGALQSDKATNAAAGFVNQNTIYTYSSIARLAEFLVATIIDPASVMAVTKGVNAIDEMIAKYSSGLDKPLLSSQVPTVTQVLVTGTTGNLGSQLLETLLRDRTVKKVYALNRPSGNALKKHAERFNDKGFDISLLSLKKLVFLESDISQQSLGLTADVYQELRSNVTVIIHSAWRLDFNLSLASFEPNIRGTRNLVDLARAGPFGSNTKLLFTSSVAQGLSWDKSKGSYPEEILMDAQYAVGIGYGESKYVSERILAQSGLKATSFRIGQISGGKPNGAWALSDWVPILVKSSIHLGALPSQVGTASWVPMDGVSQALLDVSLGPQLPSALNIVHPRPVPFDDIISALNNALIAEGLITSKLPVVPFSEWFAQVESRASDAADEDLNHIPAIKLLNFFRASANADSAYRSALLKGSENGGPVIFSTEKAQIISKTMKELPSIGADLAHSWVKYWKASGLFD